MESLTPNLSEYLKLDKCKCNSPNCIYSLTLLLLTFGLSIQRFWPMEPKSAITIDDFLLGKNNNIKNKPRSLL